jgi:hypothetical protein
MKARTISMVAAFFPLASFAQTTLLESGPTSGAFSCAFSGTGTIRVKDGAMTFFF